MFFLVGASGVGLAATQLLKKLTNNKKIFVTVGSEEKSKICMNVGADVAFNYNQVCFCSISVVFFFFFNLNLCVVFPFFYV
jgi:D-arabinose 1-dehydrogenase-like Zn-dependent alcohol dehydrogenase